MILNRYRRKQPKVDAIFFRLGAESDSSLSDASEKKEGNSVSTFGRYRLWISFDCSPVSVNPGAASKSTSIDCNLSKSCANEFCKFFHEIIIHSLKRSELF